MSEKKSTQKTENVNVNVEKKNIRRVKRSIGTCPCCGANNWISEETYKKLTERKQIGKGKQEGGQSQET